MHPSLNMDDILNLLACELVQSGLKATAVSLACCCGRFEGPVLDALWETQHKLIPLVKCLPQDVWEEDSRGFSFLRVPTKAETISFLKCARRMRTLKIDTDEDPIPSESLLTLQFLTVNELFLPRLKIFECCNATMAFIPYIPLFLSPQTTTVDIGFDEGSPTVVVASTLGILPTLCPNLERITVDDLERDPVITDAVSGMLLACNRDCLRDFRMDSPLTEAAREIVLRLPKLSRLWVVIKGDTLLPPVMLPSLKEIDIEYDDHLDWLQGFLGAALDKLEVACFSSESKRIGDFLGALKSVALTTSIQNTLTEFTFSTSRPWNPDYSSLISFKQLRELEIEFSCNDGCSSSVDDNTITTLAQAMPKLETLQLGSVPCTTPTGATVHGLITLASCCPRLFQLRIHFLAYSLVDAAMNAAATPPYIDEPVVSREDCVLRHLWVGNIPIQATQQSATRVALMLLQIFPYIYNIEYVNPEWKIIADNVEDFRRIGAFVRRAGEVCPVTFNNLNDQPLGGRN